MNVTATLTTLPVRELRQLASQAHVPGRSSMRKAELIAALAEVPTIELTLALELGDAVVSPETADFGPLTEADEAELDRLEDEEFENGEHDECCGPDLAESPVALAAEARLAQHDLDWVFAARIQGQATAREVSMTEAERDSALESCEAAYRQSRLGVPRETADFGVTTVSINGGESTSPERFDTLDAAKAHVRRSLTDLTSYWRVWFTSASGDRVAMGTRSGYNATGNSWIWRSLRDEG